MRLENPPPDFISWMNPEDTFFTKAMRNLKMRELNSSGLTVGHTAMEQTVYLLLEDFFSCRLEACTEFDHISAHKVSIHKFKE